MLLSPIIWGSIAFLTLGLAILFFYHYIIKHRNIVYFYRKVGGTEFKPIYKLVGKRYFSDKAENVRYNKNTYPVSLKDVSFHTRNRSVISIDIESKDYVWFGGLRQIGDTQVTDLYLGDSFVSKLVKGLQTIDTMTMIIIFILLGVAVLTFFLGNSMPPIFTQTAEAVTK